jgi:hypothetical protein
MNVFHISYDLNSPGQNHAKISNVLEQFDSRHIMDSSWLVSGSATKVVIWQALKPLLDKNDVFLITKVSDYHGRLKVVDLQWLQEKFQ